MTDHTTFDQGGDDPRQDELEKALLELIRQQAAATERDQPLRDAEADAAARQADIEGPKRNTREHILKTANRLVNGDRNAQYGDPNQDFQRTATYWNTYLRGIVEREGGLMITPLDVANMMVLLKMSRLAVSPNKEDHYVDIAGYIACAADVAEHQYKGLV